MEVKAQDQMTSVSREDWDCPTTHVQGIVSISSLRTVQAAEEEGSAAVLHVPWVGRPQPLAGC